MKGMPTDTSNSFNGIARRCKKCGELVDIETGRYDISKDGIRYFYSDEELPKELDSKRYSMKNSKQFRCRKCHMWLDDVIKL